jgi:hypothetical protein
VHNAGVFDIDLEHCPQCGGEFKIIAAVEEPAVIVRIFTHLGLPARRRWRSSRWPDFQDTKRLRNGADNLAWPALA